MATPSPSRSTINSPGRFPTVSVTLQLRRPAGDPAGTGIDITEDQPRPAAGLFLSRPSSVGHDSSWAPATDQSISFKNFSASQQQQPATTIVISSGWRRRRAR